MTLTGAEVLLEGGNRWSTVFTDLLGGNGGVCNCKDNDLASVKGRDKIRCQANVF